ncbi:MAG TPA: carboxypeptidase regulatory-like domain-containing protein, partial [Candidatus Sulfotelmatobacter sp.]|nr:carboxypeptidase regulatory-like domain-containing protein [Candidatus Sulfotelmatobacter sp.]
MSGATVTEKSLDTGVARIASTDSSGRYTFFALPVGLYEVRVTKDGFAEGIRSGIRLAVGQDASADLTLRVGKVSEQVKVTEDAPVVNLTTQDISGLVGERQVKDLPLNGRSYDLLLSLNPGVVNFTWEKTGGIGVSNSTTGNNFAVSGNRPQQNIFLLNGVEFTGAAENNMQPGGSSQQLLGVDAVREFNVLRDSYGPEYGKRPGGQVTIVTQSGTNDLHGSVYEFLRNSALDAPNYFDRGSAPPFQRNQFGAALGGPLRNGKTFLFGNYEGLRQHL